MHIRISSFYEYHDLAYKIFRISITVFSCLVELCQATKSPRVHIRRIPSMIKISK